MKFKENKVEYLDDNTVLINDKILLDKKAWSIINQYDRYISINSSGYAYIKYNQNQYFIHRILLDLPMTYDKTAKLIGDHINGNRLDNRYCNLRIVHKSDNPKNCKKYKNTKCLYNGVSYHPRINKWEACIQKDKKRFNGGVYKTETDAAIA